MYQAVRVMSQEGVMGDRLARTHTGVHKAFNLIMESGAGFGGIRAIFVPVGFDLRGGQAPILVFGVPVFALHHIFNDAIGIKLGKVTVTPSGDGGILAGGVGLYNVFMPRVDKGDITITRVHVDGFQSVVVVRIRIQNGIVVRISKSRHFCVKSIGE